MFRSEFTRLIIILLTEMEDAGETPVIDFVKRTDEEQKRLFDAKLSKCDGIVKKSQHQAGKAMDIYFISIHGTIDNDRERYIKWHKRWEQLGGKPMIEWDSCHFEI